jgi:hypothetical protein
MKHLAAILSVSVAVTLAACGSKKEEPGASAAPKSAAEAPAASAAGAAPAAAKVETPEAAGQLSCTNPSGSQCTDFPGGDPSLVKQQCELISGKLGNTTCAQKGRVGGCDLPNHKQITYYGGGTDNMTADLAKQDCTGMSGTWKP